MTPHARTVRTALALALALAAGVARPCGAQSPAPTASAASARTLYVRGQILAIAAGFVAFASGESLRVRAGTPIPAGTHLGSRVRVTLDAASHDVVAIEREPHAPRADEVDVADLPRAYVATSGASLPARAAGGAAASGGTGPIAIELSVDVPSDTPPTADVFVSTDRSNYAPAEIRMQRVSAQRFTVSLSIAAGTSVRYQYTRGSYATVERDRSGGIVRPRTLRGPADGSTVDTVVRWADLT